jgi:ADP-ribosylglycohydrolase
MMQPIERLAGSLLGLCLGDALGAVVEAHPVTTAREYVDRELRTGRAGNRRRGQYEFGQVTDDSQLARELLLSIEESGRLEPSRFAARIAALFARNRLVGAGPGTAASAERLLRGVPWDRAGEPEPYAGNGAAMRVAPLGVLWGADPERLHRAVVSQARVTHQDPRCAAGALAIATACAAVCRPGPLDARELCVEVAAAVQPVDPRVAGAIEVLGRLAGCPPPEAIEYFHRAGLEPASPEEWRGISADVTGSVCWSLYAVLHSPDDYWEAICTAIWAGGDTDTTAAMTGGLVGARLGLAALPHKLILRLTDQGEWSGPELIQLAERCHRRLEPGGH